VISLQSVLRRHVFPYDGAMTATTYYSTTGWRYVAGAWLALGIFDASQTVISMRAMGMQHAWFTLFFVTVACWGVWALFTPVVLGLLQRFPLPARTAKPWAVHGLACVAVAVTWATWTALLEHTTNPFAYPHGPDPFWPLWQTKLLNNLVGVVIIYGAIVAVAKAFEAQRRLLHQRAASARLAELLAQAQLAALRLQLEPHFIFNALNAVTGLIREKKDGEAITAIASLSDLLRRVTDRSERQFVSLQEEADFLRKYLDIQQLRFAERLRYHIDIPDSLMAAQVPDLILQPLVENAIKHGIAPRTKGGTLRVSAAREEGTLRLSVYNEGPQLPDTVRDGVGVANTRQRLYALYGNAQALCLQNHANDGVLATITLPHA
jgi:two-component sensor histidine kinase